MQVNGSVMERSRYTDVLGWVPFRRSDCPWVGPSYALSTIRSLDTHRKLTPRSMDRNDALRMIKRRARAAGLSEEVCCHTFRATGITAYLESGGTIEHAQQIANHESPKTTKLYDRTSDQIDLDEIERIRIGSSCVSGGYSKMHERRGIIPSLEPGFRGWFLPN